MKKQLFFFAVITLINGIIFYYRDHFQYVAYSTYADLYGECNQDCREKWGRYLSPYPATSAREARTLLEALPFKPDSTLYNLKEIGRFFYSKFHNQKGVPQPVFHSPDPVEGYKSLLADTTQKLWCGTWAQLVSFFGWSLKIVSRNVEIMRPGDHHVLNECYIPERKQWVMVDLTNNIQLASKEDRLLNAQDFVRSLRQPASVSVLTGNGTIKLLDQMEEWPAIRDYYQAGFPFFYYHTTHLGAVYTTEARLKRYFLPDSWYEIYSPSPRVALWFYVKLFFIATWVILGSLILVKLYHDRSKRPAKKLWR